MVNYHFSHIADFWRYRMAMARSLIMASTARQRRNIYMGLIK